MANPAPAPFDTAWLDELAAMLAELGRRGRPVIDLYLERRVVRRIVRSAAGVERAEVRDEGMALRRRGGGTVRLEAANGLHRAALAALLGDGRPAAGVPSPRRTPPPPAVPPEWEPWARETLERLPGDGAAVLLHRSAAVVRPGRWTAIRTPVLVRLTGGPAGGAVLGTWEDGPPALHLEAARPAEGTPWIPERGSRPAVVFTHGTGGVLIHELVGHMTEADLVVSGASPLAGRLGERIAPETLEITDDPTRAGLPGSFDHDDEGVPAAPRPLVAGGVLAGWLADGEGARHLGSEPGRGRRPGWQHPPMPRMSNLVTAAGTVDPAELEAALGRGLVVTAAGGATVDPGEGRVVLRVDAGWELVRGRRRRPLAPFHLVGAVTEVLAGIAPEIGRDPVPERRTAWCRKGGHALPTGALTPTLVVEGLEVL